MPRLLLLMVERSGTVFSLLGDERDDEGVRQALRQCCKGSKKASGLSKGWAVFFGLVPHQEGKEDKALAYKTYWNAQTQLRELSEQVKWYENAERKSGAQGETGWGAEGRCKEDGKMEVDKEVDSKKMLDQRKKDLQTQLRDILRFTGMTPGRSKRFQ